MSDRPSVRLSVRMEQIGSHSLKFHEIQIFKIFREFVENIKVWFKYDKNNEYSLWSPVYFYDNISPNSC
jgi:hypothetical protein